MSKLYRVAFFWDWRGTCCTLWLRCCVMPATVTPQSLISSGLWVTEREQDREGDLVWLPGERFGAVWIPPGRISSVTPFFDQLPMTTPEKA